MDFFLRHCANWNATTRYSPPRFMFGSPKLAKLIHILVICLATLMYFSRLGPPRGLGLPFCG
jgi:hypothetical protein